MTRFLVANSPRMLSVLRFVSALIFFVHGTQKVLWFPVSEMHPPVGSIFWIAGLLELVGGALLMLGFFTRPVAFVLSGLMAVAYWMAHAPQSFYPALNGGDAAILYCFAFLYFVFAGGGAWSLDALLFKNRSSQGTRSGASLAT